MTASTSKFDKRVDQSEHLGLLVSEMINALRSVGKGGLSAEQLQAVFAEVVRAYACFSESENHHHFGAFPEDNDISATEVAIAATGILKAVDIAVFELGMWQTLKQ